jgi:hypothetical protein
MPSGYTSTLADQEQSFREFVLHCARAFGACIHQRDDPGNDLPKLLEEDTYHLDEYNKALLKYKNFSEQTVGQWKQRFTQEKKDRIKRSQDRIKKNAKQIARYKLMLDKVKKWKEPSPLHQGLKDFMVEQLTQSIEWDTDKYAADELKSAKKLTFEPWKKEIIDSLKGSMDYHFEYIEKEKTKVVKANQWISALYDSLK